MPSNIKTWVQWKDSSVFAGEDIECVITFKNVARTAQQRESDASEGKHASRFDSLRPILERQRTVTQSTTFTKPSFARRPSNASGKIAPAPRGHKPSTSMTAAPNTPQTGWSSNTSVDHGRPPRAHGRSLSILSFGTDTGSSPGRNAPISPRRGGHTRAASLQTVPRSSGQTSPGVKIPTSVQQTHEGDAVTPPLESGALPFMSRRRSGVNTAPTTPAVEHANRNRVGNMSSEFRFPSTQSSVQQLEGVAEDELPGHASTSQRTTSARDRKLSQLASPMSPISPGNTSHMPMVTINSTSNPVAESSINGTPRTSSEFYSLSNVSGETVNSELPSTAAAKMIPRQSLSRNNSRRVRPKPDEPEHLMMGYAQTMGSFSLDGSLVNQAPFEEVKRKGIIGSHGGGGVVGVERSKRESGLFGGFGWTNIGDSLTGLLGMDEMSSLREMRSTASTKTVPMLSTPQSILFVDLRLDPGQSRCYTYKFKVPKGLPPSHRGRSIKVVYHLRIAVQRTGSIENQTIKDVEIPFRVLGSVNRDGDILGHDLMSPYIFLNDMAKTSSVPNDADPDTFFTTTPKVQTPSSAAAGLDDFLRYTSRLLAEHPPNAPLISPTANTGHERRFSTDLPTANTMQARIDLAIMRANQQQPAAASSEPGVPSVGASNRFTIARAGRHVGVLSILRPSFRLGETVAVKIDLRAPPATTAPGAQKHRHKAYVVSVSLETSELVDPSLAMRSASSVARVTRKTHAHAAQTVLFADQACFALEVPASATPSFETTGVRLEWRVRVEFVASVLDAGYISHGSGVEGAEGGVSGEADDDDEEEAGGGEEGATTEGLGFLSPREHEEPHDKDGGDGCDDGKVAASKGQWPDEEWLTADGMLENVSGDDRGRILVARERLQAETFEVGVPIKVFGVGGIEGGGGPGSSDVYEI